LSTLSIIPRNDQRQSAQKLVADCWRIRTSTVGGSDGSGGASYPCGLPEHPPSPPAGVLV